jgi:hypothetical protein
MEGTPLFKPIRVSRLKRDWRLLIPPLVLLNLAFGLITGLDRLGWELPFVSPMLHHGAIMVGGFLGTLIAVEKIIPLKNRLLLVGPLASGASLPAFAVSQPGLAFMLLTLAAANLCLVYFLYLRRQPTAELVMALCGAVCWLVGNVFLLWKPVYPMVFPWWMGFVLFTIVSERLELTRFLPVTHRQRQLLFAAAGLFGVSLLFPFAGWGRFGAGVALLLMGVWLLRFDLIRLTIGRKGQPGFTAFALAGGYALLLAEGILMMTLPDGGFSYDVMVHVFFIGFVFSMIFAHGPIILPGVLGLSVRPYHNAFYAALALLYGSLLVRVGGGIGWLPSAWRMAGGWLTTVAILLYFALMLMAMRQALRRAGAGGESAGASGASQQTRL